jgi:hypothetical protein
MDNYAAHKRREVRNWLAANLLVASARRFYRFLRLAGGGRERTVAAT